MSTTSFVMTFCREGKTHISLRQDSENNEWLVPFISAGNVKVYLILAPHHYYKTYINYTNYEAIFQYSDVRSQIVFRISCFQRLLKTIKTCQCYM